ncbi:hypothetical protein YPH_4145 [Yersinia pestis biovar Orientalis str. PEXU2]|nr:hypothetical protein YPH_4145 [Yersinia pestis biovar Orientalis str. PEXU2]EEO89145.1 hypothetical protein YPS_4008 [Yersinia pestis Pestoides A]
MSFERCLKDKITGSKPPVLDEDNRQSYGAKKPIQ